MERILQGNRRMTVRITPIGFSRGLVGYLAGTLVMDMGIMGALSASGSPAPTCFEIVGNTIARFFLIQSMETERAIQMGIATIHPVGPVIEAIFGTAVARVEALWVNTLKKSILLAILCIEILSQPLLATTPILLNRTGPQTLQWYDGSFVMHLLMTVVLGSVVGYGLPLAPLAIQRRAQ